VVAFAGIVQYIAHGINEVISARRMFALVPASQVQELEAKRFDFRDRIFALARPCLQSEETPNEPLKLHSHSFAVETRANDERWENADEQRK